MKGQAHSPAALLLFVMTWRRHGIAGLGLLFTSAAALGQPASMQAPGSYVDRVMDGQPGLDGGLQLKASEYNETGWPRSWHAAPAGSLYRQPRSTALAASGTSPIP